MLRKRLVLGYYFYPLLYLPLEKAVKKVNPKVVHVKAPKKHDEQKPTKDDEDGDVDDDDGAGITISKIIL